MPDGRIGIFIGTHKAWTKRLSEAVEQFVLNHDCVVISGISGNYTGKYGIHGIEKIVAKEFDLLIHIGGDEFFVPAAKNVWDINADGEMKSIYRNLRYVFALPEECFFEHYRNENCQQNFGYAGLKRRELEELPFSVEWIAGHIAAGVPDHNCLCFGNRDLVGQWNAGVSDCNTGRNYISEDVFATLYGHHIVNKEVIPFGIMNHTEFLKESGSLYLLSQMNNLRLIIFTGVNDGYVEAICTQLGYLYYGIDTKETFMEIKATLLSDERIDRAIVVEAFCTKSMDDK